MPSGATLQINFVHADENFSLYARKQCRSTIAPFFEVRKEILVKTVRAVIFLENFHVCVQSPAVALLGTRHKSHGNPIAPIDYDRVRRNMSPVGKLTSFPEEATFNPVGRWRSKFPPGQLEQFEAAVAEEMETLGYLPQTDPASYSRHRSTRLLRMEYALFHEFKQWIKIHTRMTRWMVKYSEILIDKQQQLQKRRVFSPLSSPRRLVR